MMARAPAAGEFPAVSGTFQLPNVRLVQPVGSWRTTTKPTCFHSSDRHRRASKGDQFDVERITHTNGPPIFAHLTTAGAFSSASQFVSQPRRAISRPLFYLHSRRHHGCQLRDNHACPGRAYQVHQDLVVAGLAPLLTANLALYLRTRSQSSCAAPSAASWQSTHAKHPAASR